MVNNKKSNGNQGGRHKHPTPSQPKLPKKKSVREEKGNPLWGTLWLPIFLAITATLDALFARGAILALSVFSTVFISFKRHPPFRASLTSVLVALAAGVIYFLTDPRVQALVWFKQPASPYVASIGHISKDQWETEAANVYKRKVERENPELAGVELQKATNSELRNQGLSAYQTWTQPAPSEIAAISNHGTIIGGNISNNTIVSQSAAGNTSPIQFGPGATARKLRITNNSFVLSGPKAK